MSRTLLEYAEHSKRSLYAIAVAAKVDTGSIYAIAEGSRGWRPETADRIMLATDGEVTPFDLLRVRLAWLNANPPRSAQKKSAEAA